VIQNCTNERQPPSPRGDNSKRVKIYWKFFKIFSRTSKSISIKLGTNHPEVRGIKNYTIQVPGPFQRGNNHKNGVGSFKNLLLTNHCARRAHIYMKAFWYNVDSILFKPWSPGVGRGHNRENHIYMCLYWKKNLLLQNQLANFNQTWYKSFLNKGYSKLFKLRARSFSKGR
jgi:hypothetical protein